MLEKKLPFEFFDLEDYHLQLEELFALASRAIPGISDSEKDDLSERLVQLNRSFVSVQDKLPAEDRVQIMSRLGAISSLIENL